MTGPWKVPTDIVDRLTSPFGTAQLVKARLRGAVFKPEAALHLRAGRYVAVIDFEEPIGPERLDGLAIMLNLLPGASL